MLRHRSHTHTSSAPAQAALACTRAQTLIKVNLTAITPEPQARTGATGTNATLRAFRGHKRAGPKRGVARVPHQCEFRGGPAEDRGDVPAVIPGRLVPAGTVPRPPCRLAPGPASCLAPGSPAPLPGRIGAPGRIRCTRMPQILPGTRIHPGNGAAGAGEAARAPRHHPRVRPPRQTRTGHRADRGRPGRTAVAARRTLTNTATDPKNELPLTRKKGCRDSGTA